MGVLLAGAGCIPLGPQDGYVQVTGVTPSMASVNCAVAVQYSGSDNPPSWRPVSGAFKEGFVVYPDRKYYSASLVCDGVKVSEKLFRYGKDVGLGDVINLTELPPNKSLERTREDKVPSSDAGVRAAQLNR